MKENGSFTFEPTDGQFVFKRDLSDESDSCESLGSLTIATLRLFGVDQTAALK